MRPWQMGHALSGTQEHLVEAIVVPLLKITKTMLSGLLGSGSTAVSTHTHFLQTQKNFKEELTLYGR